MQKPLTIQIGWHIESGTVCGTAFYRFEIANHMARKGVPQTWVIGSIADGKIASLPLMTRSLILGLAGAEDSPRAGQRCSPEDRAYHLPRRTALERRDPPAGRLGGLALYPDRQRGLPAVWRASGAPGAAGGWREESTTHEQTRRQNAVTSASVSRGSRSFGTIIRGLP